MWTARRHSTLALANIEKQFGKGSMMRLGDDAAVKVPAIPTGAWRSISPWESAVFHVAVLWRSTVQRAAENQSRTACGS
jgi:hypothetical protein